MKQKPKVKEKKCKHSIAIICGKCPTTIRENELFKTLYSSKDLVEKPKIKEKKCTCNKYTFCEDCPKEKKIVMEKLAYDYNRSKPKEVQYEELIHRMKAVEAWQERHSNNFQVIPDKNNKEPQREKGFKGEGKAKEKSSFWQRLKAWTVPL